MVSSCRSLTDAIEQGTSDTMIQIQEHVLLAPLTTIRLGGHARYFVCCTNVSELQEALEFAAQQRVSAHVLGGGSNTIFADEGFSGLVIQCQFRGLVFREDQQNFVLVTAAAGEVWDEVVDRAVAEDLAGIECLSGIPGWTGAAPVQNIGAYGQDVSQTIHSVSVFDRQGKVEREIAGADCQFGYRMSRFKFQDADRYIVTGVTFRLQRHGLPTLQYEQVIQAVPSQPTLREVRQAVLSLRRKKSMVLDEADPNTRSCGSFFMNPVLSGVELEQLQQQTGATAVPVFATGDRYKVPAAWLIEEAGFYKGQDFPGGIAISSNHPLALTNQQGTTKALLQAAEVIRHTVWQRFGIQLELEPVVVRKSPV